MTKHCITPAFMNGRRLILLLVLCSALFGDGRRNSVAGGPTAESFIIDGVLSDTAPGQPAPDSISTAVEPPPAGATVINFDDRQEPCFFFNTTPLLDRYASLGVLFAGPGGPDGGAILNECGSFGVSGHSSPNFLAFNTAASFSNGGVPRGPESISFNPPASFVQINVGSPNAGTITLAAFDQDGTPITSASATGLSALRTLSVTGSGIARLVVSFTGSVLVLDDLAFVAGVPDRDGDGLSDEEEAALGTDPDDPDTDGDGLLDGFEATHGFDPLAPGEQGQDPDGDGLDNLAEQGSGSDPRDPDSDDDGLGDGEEVALGTDPREADTDRDQLSDGAEVLVHGTDPLRADTDGGGVDDGPEVNRDHTDPLDPRDDRRARLGMIMDNLSDRAIVFDPTDNTVVGSVALGSGAPAIGDCVLSPEGSLGFATDFASRIWAVDLAAQPPRLAPPPNPIPIGNPGEDVAISADGRFLVVCDGTEFAPVVVVDTAARAQRSTFSLGSDCVTVDVCDDGSVLVGSYLDSVVRRLRLDALGNLSDTGERFSITEPQNVYCVPGARSGLVISYGQSLLRSFTLPGLAVADSRSLSRSFGLAAAVSAAGDRVYGRSAGGSIDAFGYDPLTGALSASPLFTIFVSTVSEAFYGMEQIAIDPPGVRLYVPEPNALNVYHAGTGARLASITHPDIRQPTGVCLGTTRDLDGDGLSDEDEAALGTDPDDPDTDDDGLLDGFEARHGFDPLAPGEQGQDPDGDGLDNLAEQTSGTDPRDADSDDDGLGDGQEVTLGTDPRKADTDDDGHLDGTDNCPLVRNPGQEDVVHPNGIGDACDDPDGDSVFDVTDNCPSDSNMGQEDADADARGDVCDRCPADTQDDADGDGHCADADNCPAAPNPDQADGDDDVVGDVCDLCPGISNPDQDEGAACIGVTEDGGLCLEAKIDLVDREAGGTLTVLKDLSVPPDSIRLELLDTSCAVGDTFVFILNGFLLGNLPADPTLSCNCLPPVQTFSVTDLDFLTSIWNVGASNTFVIRKIGSAAALAWVRLEVEKSGDSGSACLMDIAGGDCTETNLCVASFEFDPVIESAAAVDPLAGVEVVTTVPFEGGTLPEQIDIAGLRDGPSILCVEKATDGGGTLYGASRDGALMTIDLQTGHGTLVGVLPIPTTEIEYDPRTGRAFAQAPDGTFFGTEFDIRTGTGIGNLVPNGGSFTGLEWVGDSLYGSVIRSGGGEAPSELRILDPFTGISTLVGPTGTGAISGLAFDPSTNTMYGIRGGSGPSELLTLNLSTGAASVVGFTGFQAGSLEFGPDGHLYGGGTGANGGQFFRIQLPGGAGSLVGPTGFPSLTGLALGSDPQVVDCRPFTKRGERRLTINAAACGSAPTAVISPGSTQVECESVDGALVSLDGSPSLDPDSSLGSNDDIVTYRWFEDYGLPSQRLMGEGAILPAILPLGMHLVTLEVTDRAGLMDTETVTRTVADSLAPQVGLMLSSSTLWPPDHKIVAVQAGVNAIDRCSAAVVVLRSLASDEADDAPGAGDGATTDDVQDASLGLPDYQFLLRAERSAAGDGRTYEVSYEAVDASGNAATASAFVEVPLSQGGVTDPVSLTILQTGRGTQLLWGEVPGALFYNAIRGQVPNIRDRGQVIDLGDVVCLEANSADTSTESFEDDEVPAPGSAYFYLLEYNDGLPSSYGEESASKPRVVGTGDCR